MALVVETGTGSASSDTYASLAAASAYATAHGLTFAISGADEVPAEQALRRATVWLDASYRTRFPGYRVNGRSQALEWPRYDAWDAEVPPNSIASTEIPIEIINATIEAAVREKATPGTLSPDLTPAEKIKRLKAGSVELEYAGSPGTVAGQRVVATVIDDILSSLLGSRQSGYVGKAVRA